MPTVDEINAWTPEQRGAYYMAEVCQELDIAPDEVEMRYDDADRHVELCFDDEIYNGYYEIRFGGVFETWDEFGSNYAGAEALRKIQMAIRHIRDARRVKELEAEVKWLKANTARLLPLPIGDAIRDAWH